MLITFAAALGYVNHRFVRLPQSVGLTLMVAPASLVLVGVDLAFPQSRLGAAIIRLIGEGDFHDTVMNGMLSFPYSRARCMLACPTAARARRC